MLDLEPDERTMKSFFGSDLASPCLRLAMRVTGVHGIGPGIGVMSGPAIQEFRNGQSKLGNQLWNSGTPHSELRIPHSEISELRTPQLIHLSFINTTSLVATARENTIRPSRDRSNE